MNDDLTRCTRPPRWWVRAAYTLSDALWRASYRLDAWALRHDR